MKTANKTKLKRKEKKSTRYRKPCLAVPQILAWADNFHQSTGLWPNVRCGQVHSTDETWRGIDAALHRGNRGMPGGSSLANLLSRHRGVRNLKSLPRLDERKILRWAQAHFQRTGKWPTSRNGDVEGLGNETWDSINFALTEGRRGFPGGSSLAQFLAVHGAKRHRQRPPKLTIRQILNWTDEFHVRFGEWPHHNSGTVEDSPEETWAAIDNALRFGRRGLPGGSSLPAFLNEHRRIRNGKSRRPPRIQESRRLRIEQIVRWGEAHRQLTGNWPNRDSGRVRGTRGQGWQAIDMALKSGYRGLLGGSSLSKLFRERAVQTAE